MIEVASEKLGVAKESFAAPGDGAVGSGADAASATVRSPACNGGGIRGHGFYKNFESGPEAALCVQIAEVEVDPETGQVKLKQFTTAHSTGTVLNPLMHQGQIDGGVVMGIGYALMEEVHDRRRQSDDDELWRQ